MLVACLVAEPVRADSAVRPRFVIIVDTSGSMTENPMSVRTHGDGSDDQLGGRGTHCTRSGGDGERNQRGVSHRCPLPRGCSERFCGR